MKSKKPQTAQEAFNALQRQERDARMMKQAQDEASIALQSEYQRINVCDCAAARARMTKALEAYKQELVALYLGRLQRSEQQYLYGAWAAEIKENPRVK